MTLTGPRYVGFFFPHPHSCLPALLPPAICYCLLHPIPSALWPACAPPTKQRAVPSRPRPTLAQCSPTILGIYPPCLPARCVEIWLLLLARRPPSVSQGPHFALAPSSASVCRCSACTLGRVHVICTSSSHRTSPSTPTITNKYRALHVASTPGR